MRGLRLRRRQGTAVFRRFEPLLDGVGEHFRLAVQRQQQGDFRGGGLGEVQHLIQASRQRFGRRVLRITVLPVFDAGLQQIGILLVVLIDAQQIQPALQHVLVGVDHQAVHLLRRQLQQGLPGLIQIVLVRLAGQQRLLGDIGADQRQRCFALIGGDLGLVVTHLLIRRQRTAVQVAQRATGADVALVGDLQFGGQQLAFGLLCAAKVFRQLIQLVAGLRQFSFTQQGANSK